ncbi:Vms1/Ankzf1 family peptidyl-tRNA hydrolase [Plantactinospora sp. GCM10030261]|uniref:baeRF2 domain-containing protein n=1 Tax=Plantactinospora sp. GCM10030261 TaxID=3273420 RepID=UPI003613D1B5
MQLSFLRPLYARPGPWASVYLDASRDTEDAAPALDLRWRALREELDHQGAEPRTLDALDAVIRQHTPRIGDYGLAAFATDGQVVLTDYLTAPPRRDLAAHGPLPHTMPLVAQKGERVPWVRVVVGLTGADVDGVSAGEVARRAHVHGAERYPIHRAQPGGWSQSRYQREAMTSWKRNAGDGAAATADLAERLGAEVVVVAGEPRARQLLAAQLPRWWQDRVVQIDAGSPAWGAKTEALDDMTAQAVAEAAAERVARARDRFGMQEDVGGGLDAVVEALQRGQVDTMLIVDDPSSTDQLWVGPEATDIATRPDGLAGLAARPQRVRADAALIRALAGTDADVTVLGRDEAPDLPDGVGAVLRFVDAGTPGRGRG